MNDRRIIVLLIRIIIYENIFSSKIFDCAVVGSITEAAACVFERIASIQISFKNMLLYYASNNLYRVNDQWRKCCLNSIL